MLRLRELLDRTAEALDVSRGRLLVGSGFALAAAIAFYVLSPELVTVLSATPALIDLGWGWLVAMGLATVASLGCLCVLLWSVVRKVALIDAVATELAANSATLVFPVGPAVGGVMQVRLLRRSGASMGEAGGGVAAFSFLSVATLALLTPVAMAFALLDADPPESLQTAAWFGGGLAVGVTLFGATVLRRDWPLRIFVGLTRAIDRLALRRLGRPIDLDLRKIRRERDDLVDVLGQRWLLSVTISTTKWLLDFVVLVLALKAVDADLPLGLTMLAFIVASVLRLIPITPGGLGFVESGLAGVLTASGVPGIQALVATLTYRVATFWLPIPLGGLAYVLHRRRHPVD